MRWFDIKRYGITIYRREILAELNLLTVTDTLQYRDPRQAIQLPFEVRGAGLQANPRPAAETAVEGYQNWAKRGELIEFKNK